VVQSPFDHFVLQPIGILTNCWVRHELLLIPSISLDLLSNVLVEINQPFVRHMFDAHDQLLSTERYFPFAFNFGSTSRRIASGRLGNSACSPRFFSFILAA
jgi:hypothetical protein